VFPLSRTLDTLGPLAHTVEDCVLVDAAFRGLARPRSGRQPVKELNFFVPENIVFDGAEAAVGKNFEAALSRLAKGGAKIRRRKLPVLDAVVELFQKRGHILGPEALHVHWHRVHGPEAKHMDQRVVRRVKMAEKMTAVDFIEVLEQRRRLIAECNDIIGNALVAFPTTPVVAMPVAPLEMDQEAFFAANAKTLRNTTLGNFLDWCGVSIPSGRDEADMPTGFLISAPHGSDTRALSAGLTSEEFIRG
jgi:aspartyl-tRNA(Asn)/glutamyl-tRNA(Gln) amidotransferase subunit A